MAEQERKEGDLYIKPKSQRRSRNFFVTSSAKMSDNKNTKTTISSSVFTDMSKSFSDGDHLLDDSIREMNGGILYALSEMQQDIDDVYNEVSASVFEASFFPFLSSKSASFGSISSSLVPDKDGTHHLGASGKEWQNLFIDGTAHIDSLAMGTTVTAIRDEDDMSSDSNTSLATQQSIKAYVDANAGGGGGGVGNYDTGSHLLPHADNTYDLGSTKKEWKNLYIDGTANIDRLDVGTVSNLIPTIPAGKAGGQTIGTTKARWSAIYLASSIDVSGSQLVISSPSASAAGDPFDVVVSGSINLSGSLIPGDLEGGSIGTIDAPFKDLYVQSSSIYFANMSDHGGKSWKQMSKNEKLARTTTFHKDDIDKLKEGKSLNENGNISASGNMHIVGKTHLKGETTIEGETSIKGDTRIDGFTDIRGDFKVNGNTISNLKPALEFSDSLRAKTIVSSSAQMASNISGSFTALSASIATDIGNAGGGTVDTALKNGSTNAVTNNAVYDGLATKLNLSGGKMTGLIEKAYTSITAEKLTEAKGIIDARAISMLNIQSMKNSKGFTLILCRPSFVGQELTIIANDTGTIKHTAEPSKDEGTFVMANGKDISVAVNTAYKFVCNLRMKWIQLTYL